MAQAKSILSNVVSGRQQIGQRIVIAGQEKLGKTTLACGAPKPLLVPLEMGFATIDVPRTPMIEAWEDVIRLCEELRLQAQRNQLPRGSSIVWDSATALERLIHDYVIRSDKKWRAGNPQGVTMESAHEGYGKAYQIANELFGKFTGYADELAIHAGINTIMTCHVFASKVIDPSVGEYHTWDLQLHSPKNEKTYGKREYMTQWADLIGFLHEPAFTMNPTEGEKVRRAVSANMGRVLAVSRTPAWVAGNRYGLTGVANIPPPLPNGSANSWNVLAEGIFNASSIDVRN